MNLEYLHQYHPHYEHRPQPYYTFAYYANPSHTIPCQPALGLPVFLLGIGSNFRNNSHQPESNTRISSSLQKSSDNIRLTVFRKILLLPAPPVRRGKGARPND